MPTKTCRIQLGVTQTIEMGAFKDELNNTFMNAATTKTATLINVTDPDNPVSLGTPLTMLYVASSDGIYQVTLAHDYAAFVAGMKVQIDAVVEQGAVRYTDTLTVVFVASLD